MTTTPGVGTPPASLTRTIGWVVGAHTSVSRALSGGDLLIATVAGVPAVASEGRDSSGVGRVISSPLQVRDAAARAMAGARRARRRETDIGTCGGRGEYALTCRIRATARRLSYGLSRCGGCSSARGRGGVWRPAHMGPADLMPWPGRDGYAPGRNPLESMKRKTPMSWRDGGRGRPGASGAGERGRALEAECESARTSGRSTSG